MCGPASVNSAIPKAKLGMEEDDSGSEVDSSDEEQQTVSISLWYIMLTHLCAPWNT